MLSLRRDVSVCLSNGHLQARLYSLIMLRNEAEFVRERRRQDFVLYATLTKLIIDAANTDIEKNGRKELHKHLTDMLDNIGNGYYG